MPLGTADVTGRWWPRRWHPDTVAFALLALSSFGLSLAFALDTPLLWGADERAHVGYAIELARGNLPTIWTPVLDDPSRFPRLSEALAASEGIGRQVWVANHPPLYYVLAAPLVALGEWFGVPGAGLLAMRVLNAAATAGNVVLVGLLARELVPHRRPVHLLAAVLVASASSLAVEAGFGYNDGVAAFTATAAVLFAVRLLRRGPSTRLLLAAAAAATAAAAAKTPNLAGVAACTAMAACAGWLHPARTGRIRGRAGTSLALACVVGGVPALGMGWFYLRNIALYGDLTGAAALLEAFQRRPGAPFLETLTSLAFHRRLLESFWIRPALDPHLRLALDALFVAALLGVLLLGRDWWRRKTASRPHRADRPASEGDGGGVPAREPANHLVSEPAVRPAGTSADGPVRQPTDVAGESATDTARRALVAAWCVLLVHGAVFGALLIEFRGDGGYLRQRYLLPVVPLIVTVLAVGVLRLAAAVPTTDPRRWQAVVTLVISSVMLTLGFVAFHSSRELGDRNIPVPALEPSAIVWPYASALAAAMAVAAAGCHVLLEARRTVDMPRRHYEM